MKRKVLKRQSAMKPTELRRMRIAAGMTPTDLGAKLGISSRTVDRWEAGLTLISRLHVQAIRNVFAGLSPEPKPAADVSELVQA